MPHVGLKERFKQISMRLSEIQTKFEENIMDAIQAWQMSFIDPGTVFGLNVALVPAFGLVGAASATVTATGLNQGDFRWR